MPQVTITIGMRVQVNVAGLKASSHSAEASAEARFGSGTQLMSGTVTAIDNVRGLITVHLNGSRIAGYDSVGVTPDRITVVV